MARKKYSERIIERLRELGWEVVRPPERNMHYLNWGWRSAGTCCWSMRIRRHDEPIESTGHELTSQYTMKECATAKTWLFHWSETYFSYILDIDYSEWLQSKGDES